VGLVVAFPQRPGAGIAHVDILHEAATNWLKNLADAEVLPGCHEQVDVIGHEYVGMHIALLSYARLLKTIQVKPIILVAEKHSRTIIAALNHVLGMST
jgi:hypothetical protein